MKSRYTVLFLSLVLALALAVPALGGPMNPIASISSSIKSTANKALKKAKAAQKTANTALSTANTANATAGTAQTEAKKAQTTANSAQTTANEAKTAAATAQTTANSKFGTTVTEFGKFEPGTTSAASIVSCPAGSEVTGGGFQVGGEGANEVVPTFDSSYGDAWAITVERIPSGSKSWSVQGIAVCAKP
jgi:hypothetical protein